jgi:hypothetical protein
VCGCGGMGVWGCGGKCMGVSGGKWVERVKVGGEGVRYIWSWIPLYLSISASLHLNLYNSITL